MRGAVPAFLFVVVVIALILGSYAFYHSIQPESGQSLLRKVPDETSGSSGQNRSSPKKKNPPPNVRPETPSMDRSKQDGTQAPEPGPRGGSQ